ncbi:hypothetical protein Scep_014591 [Stephania cephalantha]|uniref:Uncharacterized protein n=1 Tax=Stephania cephalantha TaxID=152367 RepID=A0AAP0J2W9_9MAGN
MLLSWILNSQSEDVMLQVIDCEIALAHEAWNLIANLYGAHNRAKNQQCRTKIQTATKGNKSMTEYLKYMKEMSDSLSAAGNKFSKEDLISCVLAGLNSVCLPITTLLEDKI